ncbi:MAG: hypothetical protein RR929_03445 [Erysipelotrichaceae bacterium]
MKNIIKLKKTLFSITLVFILTFSLLPTTVNAAGVDTLLIGGVDIIKDDDHKIEYSNGGYAKYDDTTNTLELNNAKIDFGSDSGITGDIVNSLTINIIGNNTLRFSGATSNSKGIFVSTSILNINGTKDSILNFDNVEDGIHANNDTITLNNVILNFNKTKDVFVSVNSTLLLKNCILNVKEAKNNSSLTGNRAIKEDKITLDNTKVNAVDSSLLFGFFTGVLEISNGSVINLKIKQDAIYSINSTVIRDSIVKINSFEAGYSSIYSKGSIDIMDSTVDVSSNGAGAIVTNNFWWIGEPISRITLNENLGTKGDFKIVNSVTDSSSYYFTSFIPNNETVLSADASNASSEVHIFIKDAEYSAVDTSINNIPKDLSIYTDASVKALSDAKNAVIRGKNITEQLVVDKYAKDIQTAIDNLEIKPKPIIIDGDNQTINEGNDGVFKSDADIKDFIEVSIDGKTLATTDYNVKSGSTIITVNKDYLDKLNEGKHSLNIVSKNGTATANFTIKKNEIPKPSTPTIIDGNNQTITEGSEGTFRSDANINDFIKVSVDGKDLDSTNYTATSGSTIITLNKNYIATLSVGNHKISIVSKNGTATTNFTIKKSSKPIPPKPVQPVEPVEPVEPTKPKVPSTGIANDSYMLLSIMLLSAVIIIKQLKEN